jgi:hypothetical protein
MIGGTMQAAIVTSPRHAATLACVALVAVAGTATVMWSTSAAGPNALVRPAAIVSGALDANGVGLQTPPGIGPNAQVSALMARSAALNEKYGLGNDLQAPAGENGPAWLSALMARSAALNRKYGIADPTCTKSCAVRHVR